MTDKKNNRLILQIVAMGLLTFMGIFSETSLNISYTPLMKQFGITATTIQWLTTGYLLLLSIVIPISPFLVKKFHTKHLFQTASCTFLMGIIIGSTAVNFPMLLLGRLIMAMGTGISLPLLTNIILEEAPIEQRGVMLGTVSLVTNFAPAIGPTVGGILLEYLNWHWIFIVMIPIVLFSIISGSIATHDIRKHERLHLDVISVLLSVLTMGGFISAISFFDQWHGDFHFWIVLLFGMIALCFFVFRQLNMEKPLIQVKVFKYRTFTLCLGTLMIAQATVLSLDFLIPILLQKGMSYISLIAALTLLPGSLCGGILSPITGILLKKHHPKHLLIVGFTIFVIILSFISLTELTRIKILFCYASMMIGGALIQVPSQTYALNQLPEENNADGTALMHTLQQLAGAIGTALASNFFIANNKVALSTGSTQSTATITGFKGAIHFYIILTLVGFILAFSICKQKNK